MGSALSRIRVDMLVDKNDGDLPMKIRVLAKAQSALR